MRCRFAPKHLLPSAPPGMSRCFPLQGLFPLPAGGIFLKSKAFSPPKRERSFWRFPVHARTRPRDFMTAGDKSPGHQYRGPMPTPFWPFARRCGLSCSFFLAARLHQGGGEHSPPPLFLQHLSLCRLFQKGCAALGRTQALPPNNTRHGFPQGDEYSPFCQRRLSFFKTCGIVT